MNGKVLRAQALLLCLVLLSPGASLFASQYSDVVSADGPIAYWKLDQTTGDLAVDAIAGNNATLVGAPARDNPSGLPQDDGRALLLNGVDQYIELPDAGLLDQQIFSFEVWVSQSDLAACPPLYINLPLGAFSDARGNIIRLPFDSGCDSPTFVWGEGAGEPDMFFGGQDSPANQWRHVVVTFAYQIDTPDTFRAVRIYVDGVQVSERTALTSGISYANAAQGEPAEMVRIGNGPTYFGGPVDDFLHAYLDEIAFYDTALTPEQIEEHYYAGIQPPLMITASQALRVSNGLADTIEVSFNADLKGDTFSLNDVMIAGPDGDVVPTAVTKIAAANTYRIAIPPQTTPGVYWLNIQPNLIAKSGLAMDQDQDGIFGEPEQDGYSTSFTLGTVDPTRILQVTPTGLDNSPVATVSAVFELEVNLSSFTVDDILLTGPNGAVTPSSITTADNLSFDIAFTPALSADGVYNLSIGPNIATLYGGGMDQDQDGVIGETPDDVFTAAFELDLTPPTPPAGINYLPAPELNIVSLSPVTLQGDRAEALSIWINGVESVPLGSGAWSLPLNLVEGSNDFILEAEDRAGNRSDPVTLRFVHDTIAPVITGYTPPDGSHTHQPSTTISLSYSETGSGIDPANALLSVTRDGVSVPGSWVAEINTLRFAPDTPLADGVYLIANQLPDLAGNASAPLNHGFTLDTLAPAAPVVNGLPSVTSSAQLTATGLKEADSEILLNGQILVSRDALTDWSASLSLASGLNTLSFTARDRAGNLSPPSVVEVTFDDTAPGPVILSATDPGDGVTLLLDWRGYDEAANGNDIANYALYIETTPYTSVAALTPAATLAAGVQQHSAQGLTPNQPYYLAVVAVDAQGNRLDSVTPVSATPTDTTPPGEARGLTIVPSATSLQLSWSAPAEGSADLAGYRLYFNNDAGTPLDAAVTTAERTGLSPATGYPVRLTSLDSAGNESPGLAVTAATLLTNPAGLAAEGQESRVSLSWSAAAPGNLVKQVAVYAETSDFASVAGLTPRLRLAPGATAATVTGLSNGTPYYFAVTAINLSDGETPAVASVTATPQSDQEGPVLGALTYQGSPFSDGAVLSESGSLTVAASDLSGVSRIAFQLDGSPLATDTNGGDGFSASLNLADLADGNHTLTLTAYDVLENATTQSFSFSVSLAAPPAPVITLPASGSVTNQASLTVTGASVAQAEVILQVNGIQAAGPLPLDADNRFQAQVSLSEGANSLTALAQNRSGPGPASAPVSVTLDTQAPDAPLGLKAQSLEDGQVLLTWNASADERVVAYAVYRATAPFDDIAQAVQANTSPLTGNRFTDLPLAEGSFHYRVVALNALNTHSPPSNPASAVADSLRPRALAIRYAPTGQSDPASGRMAAGRVDVEVDVSESLLTTPFLSITPDGGVPISVDLVPQGDTLYLGHFDITDLTPSGTAYAVFSARDPVGNRGSDIDQGATLQIDTAGPSITLLSVTPAAPIHNDQADPVSVSFAFTLDQAVLHGTLPELAYRLSGPGRQSVAIPNLAQTDALHWSGSFPLPADAGLSQAETLSFQLTARDDLNTLGATIQGENSYQVYQGDLPPLEIPRNLTATAQPNGGVQLQWDPVAGAAAYQLYRQAPGETVLTPLQQVTVLAFSDASLADGEYRYAVASLRQANTQESLSGQSDAVAVTADSQVPSSPQSLALELVGAGIQALWDAPTGATEPLTYNLYRAGGTVLDDVTGLTPVQTGIVANSQGILGYLDTAPDINASVYAATAVDAAGNESPPSVSAYLNVALLPVATLQVSQLDGGYPTVTWSHTASAISGYNLYLDGSATPVNPTPLTATQYQDLGYTQAPRRYTVTALDANGVESLGRHIELPPLTAGLAQGSRIQRGVMNRIAYEVVNPGPDPVSGVRLQALIAGHSHSSAPFALAAGEQRSVALILGGYDTLPDLADIQTTLAVTPDSGEQIEIVANAQLPVTDSALLLQLETRELTRGATGEARLILENTSDVVTEILTAQGNNTSPEIRTLLEDLDGNVLASVPFIQLLGAGVFTQPNGDTLARLQPGERYLSPWYTLPIPAGAPDNARIVVRIDQFHHRLGQPEQVSIPGMQGSQAVLLQDTAYSADLTAIAPQSSYGDQPILIQGQALARDSGQPLPQVPLELVLAVNGFERKLPITTDASGAFEFEYIPQPNDAGLYTVSAIYPGGLARPSQGQFTLNRVSISPVNLRLYLAKNYPQSFDMIQATAGEGTHATNLRLVYDAVDQPSGQFPTGLTLVPAAPVNLQAGQASPLAFTIEGDNSAATAGNLVMRVVSDESGSEPLVTINLDYELSEAKPALYFSPNYLETGLAHDDTVTETLTLENRGLADLTDIQVSLLTQQDAPAPNWVYLLSPQDQGSLAIGATRQIQFAAAPTYLVPDGVYPFKLRVQSSNHPTTDINLFVAVTQSGVGQALFKASDIYTATLDENNNPIPGLAGARIRLQHEEILSIEHTGATDANGELLFSDLPAGRYRFRASAPNHQDLLGRLTVKPGVTTPQDIFLDFDLITVEWSVTEITIEDKYEITLHATFETDVPAAVVVLQPTSTPLPEMAVGDVFQGELRLTNYGLIRADGITFVPPREDGYFRYEFLANLPDTLGAKESLVIPYRVTAIAPYDPDGSASGGGCGGYGAGSRVDYQYKCTNGDITSGSTSHSWSGKASGDCGSSSGGWWGPSFSDGGGLGGGRGGGGGGGPSYSAIPGAACIPDQEPCNDVCCDQGQGPAGKGNGKN
ncbi:MAG: hypothetical protein KZQ95_09740 [Candidatus Thiodiazotropha sp. (ex Epidulcina cf. delphinae)]|nr:hypothetical protein [Candidatus Thiodiazotropha sp. (ex Epidulcina cf. delphinae)]